MTISRIKSPNWAVNEVLTSAQQNALDTNVTNALDKRAGQTDTLSSVITVASGGSCSFSSGSTLFVAPGTTATINSSLGLGGNVTFGLFSAANFSGTLSLASSGVANIYGNMNIDHSSSWYFGASLINYSDTILQGTVSSNLGFITGSNISMASGTTFNCASTVSLSGAVSVSSSLTITATATASNLTMTSTNRLKLASRAVTRTMAVGFIPATSGWSLQADALGTPVTTANTNQYGCFPLSLPDGAVVNSLIVWVEGGAGHAGAPANLPGVSLFYKQISAGGTGSVLGTKTDTYGSAPAYENVHGIQITSISHTVVRNLARLAIYVQTESGANALSGFKVHGAEVTYTVTSMDDGPCN